MLEKMNQIDWHAIESAFGTGEEIPQFLINLNSEHPDVRHDAYVELQELINHQGDSYEATSYTIPFLYELLTVAEEDSQRLITILLSNLTIASDYWAQIESIKSRPFEKSIMDALTDGFDVLVNLLGAGEKQAQINAIEILVFICVLQSEKIPQVVTLLKRVINDDVNNAIRAVAIYKLGELYEARESQMQSESIELISLFKKNWDDSEFTAVSFASSLSLCSFMTIQTPKEIEKYLINAMSNPIWNPRLLKKGIYIADQIVAGAGSMDISALLALWKLGLERCIPAIGNVLETIQSPERAREFSVFLLDWVFYRKALSRRAYPRRGVYPKSNLPLDVSQLKKHHKQALMIVLKSDSVWKESTNLLEMYGLPTDLQIARQLLEESEQG